MDFKQLDSAEADHLRKSWEVTHAEQAQASPSLGFSSTLNPKP